MCALQERIADSERQYQLQSEHIARLESEAATIQTAETRHGGTPGYFADPNYNNPDP